MTDISALKSKFWRLMDHRRYLQSSAVGCEASVIAGQIKEQNAVLSEATGVLMEIERELGHDWDWLAEEANRPLYLSRVV